MEILIAIILGIVEGLTEFLPVSSTGHLILANHFIGQEGVFADKKFTDLFEVFIQSGAVLAVVIHFWKKLFPFTADAAHNKRTWSIWSRTLIGFIPAVVAGFLLDDLIEAHLFNPLTVAIALLVWGIALILIEVMGARPDKYSSVEQMPVVVCFLIGCIQCLAMIPGTSRSAATILGALLLGAKRPAAAEFSFFLAIPTILAASAYKLLKAVKSGIDLSSSHLTILAIGTVVSFLVAWVVIRLFMSYISKHDFKVFGYYRIALALLVLALLVF